MGIKTFLIRKVQEVFLRRGLGVDPFLVVANSLFGTIGIVYFSKGPGWTSFGGGLLLLKPKLTFILTRRLWVFEWPKRPL